VSVIGSIVSVAIVSAISVVCSFPIVCSFVHGSDQA
jgi:hypothetical protein